MLARFRYLEPLIGNFSPTCLSEELRLDLSPKRDHGGGLDSAVARFGGKRSDWIDLSTGINPVPYPIPSLPQHCWTALPDTAAVAKLEKAARDFWHVPHDLGVLAVPGASAAIAHLPLLTRPGKVLIPGPTYNEHAASFCAAGWEVTTDATQASASVHVHPNNPDGRLFGNSELRGTLRIIDESFGDVAPEASLLPQPQDDGTLILKSFGKFWGLAGLRLGFVIGAPAMLKQLAEMLGPWPVSGSALHIGAVALADQKWATDTRTRLSQDSAHLDKLVTGSGADLVGGTTLFRLYEVADALTTQEALAKHHIWSRVFPYNAKWLRLGLPNPSDWPRIEAAFA